MQLDGSLPRAAGVALAPFLLFCAAPWAQEAPAPLTLADTLRPQSFTGPVPRVAWAADGRHLELGRGEERRFLDPETFEEVAILPETTADGSAESASPARVVVREDRLELIEPGAVERVLLSGRDDLQVPALSPRGDWVSVAVGGDLWLVPTGEGELWRPAEREGRRVLEGVLDWVYQEEVYGRGDFQGHWWRDDGAVVAFLELDQRGVESYPIVHFVVPGVLETERGASLETMDYPKAGDPNPVTRLGWIDVAAREVEFADLSAYPEDLLVVRVGFSPSGAIEALLQDRIQTWAALVQIDPQTGAVRELLRETSATWIERPEAPHWLADGSFLWLSERSGYQHLERRAADGSLLATLTEGEWQVRSLEAVDEERGLVWFEGTRDGALGANLYRVPLGGGELLRLTPGRGTHSTSFDAQRRFLLDRVSSLAAPDAVRLLDAESGAVLREFGAAELSATRPPRPVELLSIAARDGYPLDATLLRPAGEGPWPVFLDTYSGPDAPTVRDRWRPSTWHQFLAERGVLVLQVNVRSASGRGQLHTGTCHRQLGRVELSDLEDAVDHVLAAGLGDPQRVAISGWSYGGFMAGYALTRSNRFALGFAGAGVHDWQLYDTIYTERYMDTPQRNPEGYAASSVIRGAAGLQGHLVLLHGDVDDNVHLQNTLLLVEALQAAGKDDFELMLYPGERHGVRSDHLRRYTWRVLRDRFGLADPQDT